MAIHDGSNWLIAAWHNLELPKFLKNDALIQLHGLGRTDAVLRKCIIAKSLIEEMISTDMSA